MREQRSAYVDEDSKVIGVIGPLDSRCAAILIPALDQASGGAIPIVSPTNTYPCLTRGGAGCDLSEPGKYYRPEGATTCGWLETTFPGSGRGRVRPRSGSQPGLRPSRQRGLRRRDGDELRVRRPSARDRGRGFEGWDSAASSYGRCSRGSRGARADAVFLGGLIDQNGAQVIEDKVRALGPNDGAVALLARTASRSSRR